MTKHAGGRPTLYTPKAIEEINEYLKEAIPQNMKIPTVEGIALRLGISRDTLYEWAEVHPEFSDTIAKMKMMQKEALIETGIFGGKEINAPIIALLLKVNHDMVEVSRTELTGANGSPITITAQRGFIPPGTPITSASDGSHAIESPKIQSDSVAPES
jgi:hypothetical protein